MLLFARWARGVIACESLIESCYIILIFCGDGTIHAGQRAHAFIATDRL
jgi:hypothetical protein